MSPACKEIARGPGHRLWGAAGFLTGAVTDEFPVATWAQIAARCLRGATRKLLADCDCRGYRPLREAIAQYLGKSRGKVLLPSLRLGYLVVPSDLVDKFAAARFLTDRHASVLEQAAMCGFLSAGHFGRHIRRTRELYASRLTTLREAMHSRLAGIIDLPDIEARTHIAGWLKRELRADPIAAAAAEKNVAAIRMRRFVLQTSRPEGFSLGFAPYAPRQIRKGVDVLAAVIEGYLRKHRSTAAGL